MSADAGAHLYDDLWLSSYGDIQEIGPVHRHMRRMLRTILRDLRYKSVLDVGCGAGHNLPLLCSERRLSKIVGVDISTEALSRAAERSEARFAPLDVTQEALEERFDLVFSALVLEHVLDDRAALSNMRAMCEGHLLVTTIAGNFERYRPWDGQMGHVRNYGRGELEGKLEASGFAVERSIYWGFPFYTPLARTLQNRMTSEPTHSPTMRFAGEAMHALYFLNSRRHGDLLIVLARPV